jgi:signal peptidase II
MVKARDFYLAAIGIALADQITKYVVKSSIPSGSFLPVLGNNFGLTSLTNTGSAFGMLQGQNMPLIIVSVIVGAAIIAWHKKLAPWNGGEMLSGVILGGILGNLTDRIVTGSVFDFIAVGPWPPFNIADSALTLGVLALVYQSWKEDKK